MTNRERTGQRDMAYSTWHRQLSDSLSFIDLDWVEWCQACYKLLAVYELAYDDGHQDDKKCWITKQIAKATGLKGFLVLYSKDTRGVINGFRVRVLAPSEETQFVRFTPEKWAERLYALRWCHPVTPGAYELGQTLAPVPVIRGPRCPKCSASPLASTPEVFDARYLNHTCPSGHHWRAAAA